VPEVAEREALETSLALRDCRVRSGALASSGQPSAWVAKG